MVVHPHMRERCFFIEIEKLMTWIKIFQILGSVLCCFFLNLAVTQVVDGSDM